MGELETHSEKLDFLYHLVAIFFLKELLLYAAAIIGVVIGIGILVRYTLTYTVNKEALVISFFKKRRVPLDSIKSVKLCYRNRVLRFRKFGIGMPGLALGYYTGDYGDVKSYVTSGKNVLLIELDSGEKISITSTNQIAKKLESRGIKIEQESYV